MSHGHATAVDPGLIDRDVANPKQRRKEILEALLVLLQKQEAQLDMVGLVCNQTDRKA